MVMNLKRRLSYKVKCPFSSKYILLPSTKRKRWRESKNLLVVIVDSRVKTFWVDGRTFYAIFPTPTCVKQYKIDFNK